MCQRPERSVRTSKDTGMVGAERERMEGGRGRGREKQNLLDSAGSPWVGHWYWVRMEETE